MDIRDRRIQEVLVGRIIDALADAGYIGDDVSLDQGKFEQAVQVASTAVANHIRAIDLDTPS